MLPTGASNSKSRGDLNTSAEVSHRRVHSRGVVHPAHAPLELRVPFIGSGAAVADEFSVQVQVRTRDSGRSSPLVATPTHGGTAWAYAPHSGRSSPALASPVFQPNNEFPSSTAAVNASREETAPLEPLPPNVVHRALHGKCRFIPFPALQPFEPPPPPSDSYPLFIGQVRLETTPAELIWLFHRTCGACVTTIEARGTGCFILHLKGESERSLVRQLHKRVLFDINAVWFARTTEEVDSLCEYVALDGPYRSKQAKLPRDSMVVEDIKVDSVDGTPCFPYYLKKTGTPPRGHYNSKPSTPPLAPMALAPYGYSGGTPTSGAATAPFDVPPYPHYDGL